MRKKILLTALLIIFSTSLANAKPKAKKLRVYSGIDAQFQALSFKMKKSIINISDGSPTSIESNEAYQKNSLMPNIFLGLDIAQKLKIELGYSVGISSKDNKPVEDLVYDVTEPVSIKSKIKTEVISLDFRPYTRLFEDIDGIFVYGIIGVSHYQFTVKEKLYADGTYNGLLVSSSRQKRSVFSPTIGIGGEYALTKSFFARAQAKYNYLNLKTPKIEYGSDKIKSAVTLSLGAGYYF